jgi:hypothetical protein
MRRVRLTAVVGAVLTGSLMVTGGSAAADVPFASAIFRATHNSYSGDVDGTKHSLVYQLDHGVRFVELDTHDNGYDTAHDYGVGHNSPGDSVDHTGNPQTNNLRDWLGVVANWSAGHRSHAPLVVMLDLKDDLTDNPSFAAGNMIALNKELADVFGSNLLLAKDYPGDLPSVDALRGRVLVLLSGHAGSRAEYRRDVGYNPAVAMNSRGQIVEVHDSGAGGLWYWTGTYGVDGRVTWQRHGKYDTGRTPAIALNDNGVLVEVHQSDTASTLWSHVGHLDANGEITWAASQKYDNGVLPTVAFTSPAGTTVREIHRSQSTSQNWSWNGTAGTSAVSWTGNAKTSDARYDKTVSVQGSARVSVWTGADGATSTQTLRYSTDRLTGGRIRYEQTAFDEFQEGDSAELQQGALFYAAPATSSSFIVAARQAGRVVRGWDFDDASRATNPLANYPATNFPWTSWYSSLTSQAVE